LSATAEPRRLGFDRLVTGVIVANSALLVWGLIAHDELAEHLETGCLVFFVGELLVRLRRNGWNTARFLRDPWVAFDVVVIGLALVPTLIGTDASLLRLARLSRLIHWVRHLSHLRLWRLALRPVGSAK
jgi:voltage-gated sodium channel